MLQSSVVPGKLDIRITFQRKVVSANVSNEDEEAGWIDVATVWSMRQDLRNIKTGEEEYRAHRLTSFLDQVYTVRFRSDLDTKMRIMDGSVAYDIVAIAPVDRKKYLKITAVSGLDYI